MKNQFEGEKQAEPSFEVALKRLEEILEKMNSGTIGLDESVSLFEEADQLIVKCQRRLNQAEQKIETLIKDRATGNLVEGGDQRPLTQKFEGKEE